MSEDHDSANRNVIQVGNITIGGKRKIFMCGPCAVESLSQIKKTAAILSHLSIPIIRGGAFKPRTSPHTFQGMGYEGLDMLLLVAQQYKLLVVSEVMDPRDVEYFVKHNVDILQIGTRNMQNFSLLHEVGKCKKPILLKRGFMSTVEEMLLAVEHISIEGNDQIILCERGIRTFEPLTRNTLDLSSVALIKRMYPLPIIVDLSHSLGRTDIMTPMARAALASGCDGLMIEIHPDPPKALCDGQQSLSFQELETLMNEINPWIKLAEERS